MDSFELLQTMLMVPGRQEVGLELSGPRMIGLSFLNSEIDPVDSFLRCAVTSDAPSGRVVDRHGGKRAR